MPIPCAAEGARSIGASGECRGLPTSTEREFKRVAMCTDTHQGKKRGDARSETVTTQYKSYKHKG